MPAEIEMTEHDDGATTEEADTDHLQDIEDGAGCTEIWEHLSERRAVDPDDD